MNQQYNIKFSNINLLDVMGRVVEKHTQHYQSDFAIDTDTLRKAAVAPMQQGKSFIWLCRTMGTWCLRERDVFLTDTRQHNTFCFYQEQVKEPVLAYAVEVKCAVDGNVIGNLYSMDYRKFYEHVKTVCLRSVSVLMRYERGELVKPVEQFNGWGDYEFGELQSFQFFPKDEGMLRSLLREERRKRAQFTEDNVTDYLANL